MNLLSLRWILFVVLLSGAAAGAEIPGKIVSAGLYKNGLAVITREYTLPGPGEHRVASLGAPIHGTLWIESPVAVTARLEQRLVAVDDGEEGPLDLYKALAGKAVRVYLRDADLLPIEGTLLPAAVAQPEGFQRYSGPPPAPGPAFHGVKLADGRLRYVAADLVAGVESLAPESDEASRTIARELLLFQVPEDAEGPVVVRAHYLARGLSWAPAYRITLEGPETLTISQSATVRNELAELEDVETALISGFPSVEFAHVVSPFSEGTSWSDYFASLSRSSGPPTAILTQNILSNSSRLPEPGEAFDGDLVMPGEGPDLHYQPAGRLSLKQGGGWHRTIATAQAAYTSVVEWRVPELRHPPENFQADMWDGVLFRNPFDFPMTTAPAAVVADGRFLGSRTTHWAGPGEETIAYVSKTLSVRASAVEVELDRVRTTYRGRAYWKSTLEGTLTLANRRGEPVHMVIHKELEGTLHEADGAPEQSVGAAGPGGVNPSVAMTWRIGLAPGAARSITYRYTYLIP